MAHHVVNAPASEPPDSLYERDYYMWALEQARELRAQNTEALDWENLAEEVEGLARAEARELRSRLEVLLVHLLKWRHQRHKRSTSWRLTIREQRRRVAQMINENPGLKRLRQRSITEAYEMARLVTARETKRAEENFPPASPWSFDEITSDDFWPNS